MKRIVIIALVAVSSLIWLGYSQGWTTGFQAYIDPTGEYHPAKTLWDWMELLIIPVVLAGGGLLYSWSERRAERGIADERNRETILQTYLDRMTELMLEKGLRTSQPNDEVRDVARARTLTALRSSDGQRKAILIRFLYETELIKRDNPIIALEGADLSRVNLGVTDLSKANLSGANLREADLIGTNLEEADLSEADLRGVDARGTWWHAIDLSGGDLRRAKLRHAHLNAADLSVADLRDADLSIADLEGANLSAARLRGANLSGANLLEASFNNLTELTGVCYNEATCWPEGFIPPPGAIKLRCWRLGQPFWKKQNNSL